MGILRLYPSKEVDSYDLISIDAVDGGTFRPAQGFAAWS
jgi:hypothetical protein